MQCASLPEPGNLQVSLPRVRDQPRRDIHRSPSVLTSPPHHQLSLPHRTLPLAMAMDATNLSAADTLIGERVVARTKQAYGAKIKTIANYYSERLQQPFTVPVQRDHILQFFGWLINEKHKHFRRPPLHCAPIQFRLLLTAAQAATP